MTLSFPLLFSDLCLPQKRPQKTPGNVLVVLVWYALPVSAFLHESMIAARYRPFPSQLAKAANEFASGDRRRQHGSAVLQNVQVDAGDLRNVTIASLDF